MLAYRITSAKYSNKLLSSGFANRWNKEGEFVIYSAQSRSLATLELVVHRASIKSNLQYKVLEIKVSVPKSQIEILNFEKLPKDWRSVKAYNQLQEIGSKWYIKRKKLILQIPSAIIPKEFNYVINTKHELFKSNVEILGKEDYFWDERLIKKD